MENKDFSIYKYYKGSEDYPNDKARYFGFYEKHFDDGYTGNPDDKEEAFKDVISNLLYEKASEYFMFGTEKTYEEKMKKYNAFIKYYFNPEQENIIVPED